MGVGFLIALIVSPYTSFTTYSSFQKFSRFAVGIQQMRIVSWVPLLACPAVLSERTLLGKPAVAPASQSVITFKKCYSLNLKHI